MNWFDVGISALWLAAMLWTGHRRYLEGVWDATHNPSIPPVVNALKELEAKGWKAL